MVNSANLKTASTIVVVTEKIQFLRAELSGGFVFGGADNDTLNFLAGVNNAAYVSGDAGSDLLLFQHDCCIQCLRWRWWRLHILKGAVSNSTIDFGADNDTFTLSVASSTSSILGGSGVDTWSSPLAQTSLPAPSPVVLTMTLLSSP